MLFDLKGHRRRFVQVTYVILALLMGGGLVLFGVGSGNISGGLLDAITGGGGSSGSSVADKQISAANKRLALNPRDEGALKTLVRSEYLIATSDEDRSTGRFTSDAMPHLQKASSAWQRYLALNPKRVDTSLANLMLQAYSELGLNKPSDAAAAAEVVAGAQPSAAAYLRLALYAKQAGQTRKAQLAGQKAIQLAPKGQRSAVKAQVKQIESGAATASSSSG